MCSEGMSEDRKGRYISYLVDRVNDLELDKKAMELVLEDFLHTQQEMKEEQAEMKKKQDQMDSSLKMSYSKLDEEIMRRKKAEQKAEKLQAQLKFAKKNKFGDKQQKVNKTEDKDPSEENPDRTNEKDNFDGTADTLETKPVSEPSDTPEPK